jgi:cell division protein FtsL
MWRCSLNRAENTYWLNNRRITQQAAAQALPALPTADPSRALSIAAVSRWLGLIPSWIILGMVLLATLGICSTVIVRTQAELQTSALQYERMTSEIDSLRRSNNALEIEIRRMNSDPSMIESAARSRLGMVRPNDIVVPIESVQAGSNLGTLSFVR